MDPCAIGYLRQDISGHCLEWDRARMASLARRLGYRLAETVTMCRPICSLGASLVQKALDVGAEAVILPSATHVDRTALMDLVRGIDVITVEPETTFSRWSTRSEAATIIAAASLEPTPVVLNYGSSSGGGGTT